VVGKPLGGNIRPPARLFNPDEVRRIYGHAVKTAPGKDTYYFDNDEYTSGFCYKDVKLATITSENVKPTLEEVARFQGIEDESTLDLSAIAEANKNITVSGLFPGDQVEVFEGEQSGLKGVIETVTSDVITLRREEGITLIEVAAKSVRKCFELGEHVKVLHGRNADASGMVVDVKGDVVTIMSDQGEQEVS
jgi:transcription elongation factor SPT5